MLAWDSSQREDLYRDFPDLRDGWKNEPGFGEKMKLVMDYGFAPIDTEEKAMAVMKWSANPNASYDDMPPGAMRLELPAGFSPILGEAQALRDIWKDLKHKDVSGWTFLDAASLIPAIGGIPAMLGHLRHSDTLFDLAKGWKFKQLHAEPEKISKVAYKRPSGEVVPGEPGDVHAMMLNRDPSLIAEDAEAGFVGDRGPDFRSREQAKDLAIQAEQAKTATPTLTAEELHGRGSPSAMRRIANAEPSPAPLRSEVETVQEAVTDLDRQIAKRHNDAFDNATPEQRAAGDVGSSTGPDGKDPTERYMVAPDKKTETAVDAVDGHITPEQVAEYRQANPEGAKFVGTWLGPDGKVWFDLSDQTADRGEAIRTARKGQQEGIFDREAGRFVATPASRRTEAPGKTTNRTPVTDNETVNSIGAKVAGLSLMDGTSIDDAMDWALESIGPEVMDYADDIIQRADAIRGRWQEKLGTDVSERMLKRYQEGSEHFTDDWYESILPTAKELMGDELGPIWARMYAYTSTGVDATGANITHGNKALAQYVRGEPIKAGLYPSTAEPLISQALKDMESAIPVRHVDSSSGIKAAKLREFDADISFGGDRAIIDMWQSRLAQNALARGAKDDPKLLKQLSQINDEGYQVVQGLTEGLARQAGVSNKGFQAGTWAGEKQAFGDRSPLITGGEAIRRHPSMQDFVPDEKTGVLLPSFVGKGGRPVSYRTKYGIPALAAGYVSSRGAGLLAPEQEDTAGAGLLRGARLGGI
jgi:hypothetical protein